MNASLRKILLGLGVLLLIFVIFWGILFFTQKPKEESDGKVLNLFPFGEISLSQKDKANEGDDIIPGQTTEDDEKNPSQIQTPRLRQLTDFPTAGFAPLTRVEKKEVPDIFVDENGEVQETTKIVDVLKYAVRYTDIESGSIYEAKLSLEDIDAEMLVDNFIPNAEYAYFNNDGDIVVYQYWNIEEHVPESYIARIKKIELSIDPCPSDFSPVELGEDDPKIIGLHKFLNRDPKTQLARSGVNSPGNESSLVSEATITAIKNFQSLYQIDIDGKIGPATKAKMVELCDAQQLQLAEEKFEKLDKKYSLNGLFLPQNLISINLDPSGKNFFFLQKDNQGVSGIIQDIAKGDQKLIFESPFTEWTSEWNNQLSIELSTKPSYAVPGFSFALKSDTGEYSKVLDKKNGLITLASPDNTKILFSETQNNRIRTGVLDKETGKTQYLPLQTLADKCVWSKESLYIYCGVPLSLVGNEYPDLWYQGLQSFTDSLWGISVESFKEVQISNLSREYEVNLDIEKMGIDERNGYLYFIDKNTEFLWSYRLDASS